MCQKKKNLFLIQGAHAWSRPSMLLRENGVENVENMQKFFHFSSLTLYENFFFLPKLERPFKTATTMLST